MPAHLSAEAARPLALLHRGFEPKAPDSAARTPQRIFSPERLIISAGRRARIVGASGAVTARPLAIGIGNIAPERTNGFAAPAVVLTRGIDLLFRVCYYN